MSVAAPFTSCFAEQQRREPVAGHQTVGPGVLLSDDFAIDALSVVDLAMRFIEPSQRQLHLRAVLLLGGEFLQLRLGFVGAAIRSKQISQRHLGLDAVRLGLDGVAHRLFGRRHVLASTCGTGPADSDATGPPAASR